MSLDDLKQLLGRWPDLLLVALVIGPIIWAILNATYRNRLEAMREDIDRLRARLGDEPTRKSVLPEPVAIRLAAREPATFGDLKQTPGPDVPSGLRRPDQSFALELEKTDANGYPSWMKALPPVRSDERPYLPPRAGKEIHEAMRALPPLSREAAARSTFVGKWLRGSGAIRAINERQETISVFVSAGDGNYFLDFPLAKRPLIEALREGQQILFEGQIHGVGDGHVSLIHALISVEQEGKVSVVAT